MPNIGETILQDKNWRLFKLRLYPLINFKPGQDTDFYGIQHRCMLTGEWSDKPREAWIDCDSETWKCCQCEKEVPKKFVAMFEVVACL